MAQHKKKPFRLGDVLARLRQDGSLSQDPGPEAYGPEPPRTPASGFATRDTSQHPPSSARGSQDDAADTTVPPQPVFEKSDESGPQTSSRDSDVTDTDTSGNASGKARDGFHHETASSTQRNDTLRAASDAAAAASSSHTPSSAPSSSVPAASTSTPSAPPPSAPASSGPPPPPGRDGGYRMSSSSAPDADEDEEFDVYRYLSVILRRKWLIVACTIIAGMVTLYSFLNADKYYIATARLLFTPGYRQLINDDAMMWQLWGTREIRLNTHLDLLKTNREVLQHVTARFDNNVTAGAIKSGLTVKRGGSSNEDSENNIIRISFQYGNPDTAQLVLNSLCRHYLDYISEVNARDLTATIVKLQTQIKKVKDELTEKENRLREFKEKNEFVELDNTTRALVSKLSEMESNLQNTRIDLKTNREKVESVKQQMKSHDMKIVEHITYEDPYQNRLSELEFELNNLLTEYSADHYKVKMVEKKIDKMKEILRSDIETKVARSKTYVNNPIQRSLMQQFINLTLAITALESKRTAQEQIVENLTRKLHTLPALQQNYARLQRNTRALEKTLAKLQDKHETLKIKRDSQESDLKILELAKTPTTPYSSMSTTRIPLGLLIGLIIGIALAFIWEYLDQTLKDPQEVEKTTGLPLLGLIPYYENEASPILQADLEKEKTKLEPYRALRAGLKHILKTHSIRSLLICSAVKGEGKTTIAINLAIVFALDGKKVVIVDGDLRRPSLHKFFDMPANTKGLTEWLQGESSLDDVLSPTGISGLSCVCAGERVSNSAELLGSTRLSELKEQLYERADLVLFDSPALLPISDTIAIAATADATLCILRALWSPRKAIAQTKSQLEHIGSSIIGAVLNGLSPSSGYYPYYYGYYRYYSYKYAYEDETPEKKGRLRKAGLHLENKTKQLLQTLKLSLPGIIGASGRWAASMSRSVVFWILLVLFAGLSIASVIITSRMQRNYRRAGEKAITYRGVHKGSHAASGSSDTQAHPPPPIAFEPADTSIRAQEKSSPRPPLTEVVQRRDSALLHADFDRYIDHYHTREFAFPGGTYTAWRDTMRSFFAADLTELIPLRVSADAVSRHGSTRATSRTTFVSLHQDTTTHLTVTTLWKSFPSGWKVVKEKHRLH